MSDENSGERWWQDRVSVGWQKRMPDPLITEVINPLIQVVVFYLIGICTD